MKITQCRDNALKLLTRQEIIAPETCRDLILLCGQRLSTCSVAIRAAAVGIYPAFFRPFFFFLSSPASLSAHRAAPLPTRYPDCPLAHGRKENSHERGRHRHQRPTSSSPQRPTPNHQNSQPCSLCSPCPPPRHRPSVVSAASPSGWPIVFAALSCLRRRARSHAVSRSAVLSRWQSPLVFHPRPTRALLLYQ